MLSPTRGQQRRKSLMIVFSSLLTRPEAETTNTSVDLEKNKGSFPVYNWLFRVGRLLLDAVLVNIGFYLAVVLRYNNQFTLGSDSTNFRPINDFFGIMFGLTILTLMVLQIKGFYRDSRTRRWLDEVIMAGSAVTTSIAVEVLLLLVWRPVLYSRLVFAYAWLVIFFLFALDRYASRQLRVRLWQRGYGIRHLLVIGAGKSGQRIMQQILETPDLGYKLAGFVEDDPEQATWTWPPVVSVATKQNRAYCLGTTSEVENLVKKYGIHEIIIALPSSQHERVLSVIEDCQSRGVGFLIVPDLFELSFNLVHTEELNGVPLIGLRTNAIRGFNLFLKRAFDIFCAGIALFFLMPFMAVVALLIKLDSPGPIFFHQTRVGKNGQLFKCHKFRSMRVDAEKELSKLRSQNQVNGPIFKMKNDPRVTRIGRIIRALSIDELPQLYNVLMGDMSLVGPRPPIPAEVDLYEEWHKQRLDVTPGITSLWAVSGRSQLGFDEMVKLDIYYAENWSLTLDFKILIRTLPVVLMAKGAY